MRGLVPSALCERMSADAPVLPITVRRPSAASPVALDAPPSRVSDFRELLKPGISTFVVVTAAAGYLFGAPGGIEPGVLLALLVGTGLTAGGSGALNHVWERKHDALMQRTQDRPIPSGRVSAGVALAYGLVALTLGLIGLALFVNTLTTVLAAMTALAYVLVYTPLKRRTKYNTFVGAVPGALPALGGFAAATGTLGAGGWAIFAILYLWQLPHFFSLAWMYREDYARGGFAMLPAFDPEGRATALWSLVATLALVVAGVVPTALGYAGWVYLIGMAVLGTWFTLPAFSFYNEPTHHRARRLLLASIAYVPVFFALVVLDYLLA